ncbi:MAG: helix-turn-helix domain-containing protein [Clostridia bacterium]|nr:helix-turn-helix domain-containing protein [Clostridia bacterium]MBP3300313.1 helix-turn-helix domain-containing protein [Clostridia bacterium]
MDQIKIGKFIAERRKARGLTQLQLADRLGITDRAVSKWERGKTLPDSSLMLDLCGILKISVNDLLSGEVVTMEKYNEELEKKLLETIREKERADQKLLMLEVVVGILCIAIFVPLILVAGLVQMEEWLRVVLILVGFLPLLAATPFMLRIEQTAGYYECQECGHRYVPSFKAVFLAMHMGRTRYMKCPKCGKRSWQKKVISKE